MLYIGFGVEAMVRSFLFRCSVFGVVCVLSGSALAQALAYFLLSPADCTGTNFNGLPMYQYNR